MASQDLPPGVIIDNARFYPGGNYGLASFYPGVTIVGGKNGLPHRCEVRNTHKMHFAQMVRPVLYSVSQKNPPP